MDTVYLPKLIIVITGCLVVLFPVMALTARFALKPIVEAIARLREAGGSQEALRTLERRMELLEQEVQGVATLRQEVGRLAEAQEFQLQLAEPLPAAPPHRNPGAA